MATLARPERLRFAVLLGGCLSSAQAAATDEVSTPTVPWPAPVAAEEPPATNSPEHPRLTITSDTTCPSGPATTEALAKLLPPAEWPRGSFRIQATADRLIVDLVTGMSARREVRVAADCAVRATTAALVIATWTGELASEVAGAPVLRGRTVGSQGDEPAPRPSPPAQAPAGRPAPSVVVPRAIERALGAGLLLSVSEGIAPGVHLDFVQTRAPSGLGWQAGLTLPARRELASAGGTTSWTRVAASLAVNGRLTFGRAVASLDVGLAAAYTLATGNGYPIAQGTQALTGGLVGGARFALPLRRVRVWTAVHAYRWLLPQTIAVDAVGVGRVDTVALPAMDFQWAAGLSYPFR